MGYNLPMSTERVHCVGLPLQRALPGKARLRLLLPGRPLPRTHRNLASYLVYDLDRILVFLEDLLSDYMREVDPDCA